MAGSYRNVVDCKNRFRCDLPSATGYVGEDLLLDDLGDAYEAIEEMYDMIEWLSGGDKMRVYAAWREGHLAKRKPGATGMGFNDYWDCSYEEMSDEDPDEEEE